MLVDSHAHVVDEELKPFLDMVLSTCEKKRIQIFANSTDEKSSIENIRLTKEYPGTVKAFVGIHPWEAHNFNEEVFKDVVTKNLAKVSGIGEIGLDGKYVDRVPFESQKKAFESQLAIAEEFKFPVCVHSRRAHEDVLKVLDTYSLKGVLLHWFSGSEEQMKRGLDKGYFFSFGPTIVYSKGSRRLMSSCSTDRVLLETDSPVHYDACFENRLSTPLLVGTVYYSACNIFKKSLEETLNIILENSQNYIGRKSFGDEFFWAKLETSHWI